MQGGCRRIARSLLQNYILRNSINRALSGGRGLSSTTLIYAQRHDGGRRTFVSSAIRLGAVSPVEEVPSADNPVDYTGLVFMRGSPFEADGNTIREVFIVSERCKCRGGRPSGAANVYFSDEEALGKHKNRMERGFIEVFENDILLGHQRTFESSTARLGEARAVENKSSQENRVPDANSNNTSDSKGDKPSLDELQRVYNVLQKSLERTFTHTMDFTIYHQDVLFIDNIRHLRTQGLARYIQQVALLKTVGHIKFAFVKFEIVNMGMSQEEGRITVRWRIKGLSGLRVMLKFWKYKLWKWQELKAQQETWYDGISYFDVGADGKIFQHVADKVMEDKHREIDEKPSAGRNIPLTAKLAGLATIFPTPSLYYGSESLSSELTASDGGVYHPHLNLNK